MNKYLDTIVNLLISLYKIDVSKYDVFFLEKSINRRILETHCNSIEDYINYLKQNKQEGKSFFDFLQISYSEFFRNPLTFSVLERIILPSIILKKKENIRKELRIWSAACAAGQESYSIAMVLEELKNNDNREVIYRIFATDQSQLQVTKASKGQFNASELNNLNVKRVKQWFIKRGDIYSVKQELKENINFTEFDLFSEQLSCPSESIYGDFDIVICANLLFYYKPEFRETILKKITNCLAEGGYIITGEAEREILLNQNYYEVFPQSAIFKKK